MHAEIHVYTFKAGLLARLAHDLRLRVQRHELHVEAGKVRGHCDASSLTVEGVMTERGLDSTGLSERDKRQISETVRSEILRSDTHPRIELEADVSADATSSTLEVRGQLSVRGRARPVQLQLQQRGDQLQGAFELTPSEFGIAPYKALAGAIKLQDRVRVHVEIALQGQSLQVLLAQAQTLQP
jgi:polyisoprenoid-binding protein YceI